MAVVRDDGSDFLGSERWEGSCLEVRWRTMIVVRCGWGLLSLLAAASRREAPSKASKT